MGGRSKPKPSVGRLQRESPDQVVRNGEKTEMGERMRQERGRRGGRDKVRGSEEQRGPEMKRGRVNRRDREPEVRGGHWKEELEIGKEALARQWWDAGRNGRERREGG